MDEEQLEKKSEDKPLGIRGLLGIGLDGKDGHERLTRGPKFVLIGGSKDTHEKMQETALKFNERVKERSKPLERITARELEDIAAEVRESVE